MCKNDVKPVPGDKAETTRHYGNWTDEQLLMYKSAMNQKVHSALQQIREINEELRMRTNMVKAVRRYKADGEMV